MSNKDNFYDIYLGEEIDADVAWIGIEETKQPDTSLVKIYFNGVITKSFTIANKSLIAIGEKIRNIEQEKKQGSEKNLEQEKNNK